MKFTKILIKVFILFKINLIYFKIKTLFIVFFLINAAGF